MERDPITKQLVPDRKRFPSGIKALADYVSIEDFKKTMPTVHTKKDGYISSMFVIVEVL